MVRVVVVLWSPSCACRARPRKLYVSGEYVRDGSCDRLPVLATLQCPYDIVPPNMGVFWKYISAGLDDSTRSRKVVWRRLRVPGLANPTA